MCVKETRFLFPVIFMVWGFSEVRGRERKINDVEIPYSARPSAASFMGE